MPAVIIGTQQETFDHPILAEGFRFALGESTVAGLVICAVLLIISSYTWAVMVTKYRTVSRARQSSRRFLDQFRSSRDPLSQYSAGVKVEEAPVFLVYQAGCKELSTLLLGESDVDESYRARLDAAGKISPTQMQSVQMSMERSAGESVLRMESSMTTLATAVSGAPFLGLLGTVWGVMDTFVGVAAAGSGAGLASMAPGVSSALVTTVVALLVAIPAMFGYNFLAQLIKSTVVELDNFSAEFCTMLDRQYVDHGQSNLGIPTLAKNTGSIVGRGSPNGSPAAGEIRNRKKPKKGDAQQPSLLEFANSQNGSLAADDTPLNAHLVTPKACDGQEQDGGMDSQIDNLPPVSNPRTEVLTSA